MAQLVLAVLELVPVVHEDADVGGPSMVQGALGGQVDERMACHMALGGVEHTCLQMELLHMGCTSLLELRLLCQLTRTTLRTFLEKIIKFVKNRCV